jgi:hypothetical protein
MHPTPPAADGPLQIVALTHKNNQTTFSSYRGTKILRVLTKSWSQFIQIGPAVVARTLTKLSIQLFLVSAHLQGVAHYKIMHPTPADGPFQIVALTHKIIRTTFHRIRPRMRVLTKIMEPNFIRISPPVVARTQKVINTTVLEYHYLKVLCTHKNHASDTGGGWVTFQIVSQE